ncbi:hypothetical protein TNCV_709611 [Trichonephila clavipes]|nr:hypothetical protein TNCV_709611 [Trichonephila clavipes]
MRLQIIWPAKAGIKILYMTDALLFSEIATHFKHDNNSAWRLAPVHERYGGNRPGAVLLGTSYWWDEITPTRFHSGHTQAQRHVAGLKFHPPCPNCNVTQAALADNTGS